MRRKERSTKQLRDSVPEELEEQCLPSVKEERQVNKPGRRAAKLFSVSSKLFSYFCLASLGRQPRFWQQGVDGPRRGDC